MEHGSISDWTDQNALTSFQVSIQEMFFSLEIEIIKLKTRGITTREMTPWPKII
jgi:hypothetical protein